ncbi:MULTISPECIES: NAD(P)/FAD-dependent oxidoreductase [Atopobiaceae]|uniref:Thioredoxin reductase n=1 Tax=Parafannyhessea umbonata TaxID=604330 RepID=A0A1H6JES6_9ACTN|nr:MULTISPECIES: FAD-dependent oxidoreductase [Atopobiaceae]SEH60768.1 Thioredoxin reductase [Parafannyhessea umbonata]SJZ80864.1 Thioredoxin reductase [Olsenella sp. KH1P3]
MASSSEPMVSRSVDVLVVGGGSAGLAAAISARKRGARSVLILERDGRLGGILNQCVHNGFGLHTFNEELTGPEYAARYVERARELKVEYLLNTTVLSLSADREVVAVNARDGVFRVAAGSIVLAMGCRERPRGALDIPGTRPAGVYTAGTAQRLVNVDGFLPGREVVILGSGDIGLIMARRLTLEGAHVSCVCEIMPYSGGLKRNIVQCLEDFGIPLLLSHTVVNIEGAERVQAVTIAQVDEDLRPIAGTERRVPCDTLLLSVGLLPENELAQQAGIDINPTTHGARVNESLETSAPGIFACGNVLHVHDLVDYVSEESAHAGSCAARFALRAAIEKDAPSAPTAPMSGEGSFPVECARGVRCAVPSFVRPSAVEDALTLRFRVDAVYRDVCVSVYVGGRRVSHRRHVALVPAEMLTVRLRASCLEGLSGDDVITIALEEG